MLLIAITGAHGQSGASSITGTARDSLGMPLDRVVVEARDGATGYVARTNTNSAGRYVLLGLPLGGRYIVRTRRIGFLVSERRGLVLTLGARLTADFVLRPLLVQLSEVTVGGAAQALGRDGRLGGSTRIAREQIDALPITDRNFSSLAALSPLAGNQLALGGQRWTTTDFRIDGAQSRNLLRAGEANGGPAAISLEAVREFEVNTAVFDAGQGRQGGGQIAAVTRAGTNTTEARLTSMFRSAQLSGATDFQGRTRTARAAQVAQSALAVGGPLVPDRAHYFVAYERQDASEPLLTGDVNTQQAEITSGIARDSLRRVLDILERKYGSTGATSQLGRLSRRPVSQNLFARVDWQVTPAHRAMARVIASDWVSPLSGGVDQPITLREARSGFRSREVQLLTSLTSTVHNAALNELQLAVSHSRRALEPESPGVPRGFVQVRSLLPDGTTGNSTIQFGGNRLAPDDSREWQLQVMDRFVVPRGPLLLTLGTDNSIAGTRTLIAESQSGLFVFPSIDALEAMQPNRFSRTVPLSGTPPITRQHVIELGAYAQAEWQVRDGVTWTTGLRWDGTAFLDAPPVNAPADSIFGVRTARAPHDWTQLQPRMQLVWHVDRDGRDVVRIGAGVFSAQLPYYSGHNQLLYSGSLLSDVDLRAPNVPAPDFSGYRAETATVPGVPRAAPLAPAFINVAGSVRAPRTFKATAAWSRRVGQTLAATIGANVTRMRDGYHYVDRNLPARPAFRLFAEAGRSVWVPAPSISPATGATDVRNASREPAFARVLALESGSRAHQFSVTGELVYRKSERLGGTFGYAWARARDNSSFGCCLARTATAFTPVVDDPRDISQAWAASDFDARHRLVATVTTRMPFGVTVAARYVGTSGRPFSLVVDGDINGDEANGNDRAFLFDPDDPATPADVAASMRRVLANRDNVASAYILAHLGQIAGRNAVYTPWTNRVDARLSRRFAVRVGFRGNAEFLVDIFNVGNLLNRRWGSSICCRVGFHRRIRSSTVCHCCGLWDLIRWSVATDTR